LPVACDKKCLQTFAGIAKTFPSPVYFVESTRSVMTYNGCLLRLGMNTHGCGGISKTLPAMMARKPVPQISLIRKCSPSLFRCAMCTQLCLGFRRAFIGRQFSPNETRSIDKKINSPYLSWRLHNIGFWGEPQAPPTMHRVTIRGEKIKGFQVIKASLGKHSCTFKILGCSEIAPSMYPHPLQSDTIRTSL
jgi:hypothetical protein